MCTDGLPSIDNDDAENGDLPSSEAQFIFYIFFLNRLTDRKILMTYMENHVKGVS